MPGAFYMQMSIEMFNRLNDPFALVHTGLQLMIIPPSSTNTLLYVV